MHYLGLIGYPLGHSVSAVFQQAALDYYQLEARYLVWETAPEQVKSVVQDLRRDDHWGANVTVPYKETVIPFLDGLTGEAADMGAVNVIYKRGARLLGTNTDVYGFLHALSQDGGFNPDGKKAVILGAGGAARAVVYGLVRSKAASVVIANRNLARAEALLTDIRPFLGAGQQARTALLAESELQPFLTGCDLIVNCTSLGMKGAQVGQTPLSGNAIPRGALVFDVVYNPPETLFLRQARAAGARILGGLPMLVYQGAAAFEIWTDKKAPVDIMLSAAREALCSVS